jgi:hypothetical protein
MTPSFKQSKFTLSISTNTTADLEADFVSYDLSVYDNFKPQFQLVIITIPNNQPDQILLKAPRKYLTTELCMLSLACVISMFQTAP